MVFKEMIQKLKSGRNERSNKFKQLEEDFQLRKMLEERQKSANERELEKFQNENREEFIKEQLEIVRKNRDHDIKFNHNPLDTKNITASSDFQILKQKNLFDKKSDMFSNKDFIHKNNCNIL